MTAYRHLDEARAAAVESLSALAAASDEIERAVLIDDLFGKLRVVLWQASQKHDPALVARLESAMTEAGRQFWTGTIWIASAATGPADRLLYDAAWEAGRVVTPKVRLDDRHRNRTAWFSRFRQPPWLPRRTIGETAPPIVAFLSFKGGVGRTTALAAFAIQRARAGERVVVVDFDLDAPGIGTLLAMDEQGTTAPWGVVDYLLERSSGTVPLDDYTHRVPPEVAGDGSIVVVPAGRIDANYLTKLARVDLELGAPAPTATELPDHPLAVLLDELREQLNPAWILIDARAGLSPAAGLLMSGFAHLYVLFGTTNEQSFVGMERMVHRLGSERLGEGAQAECFVVHAMVPENPAAAEKSKETFRARAEDIFRDNYLVQDDPTEELWSVADIGNNAEAPFVPVEIPYSHSIAFFTSVVGIAPVLCQGPYNELAVRIQGRFPIVTERSD